jgi:hypothetical protein
MSASPSPAVYAAVTPRGFLFESTGDHAAAFIAFGPEWAEWWITSRADSESAPCSMDAPCVLSYYANGAQDGDGTHTTHDTVADALAHYDAHC